MNECSETMQGSNAISPEQKKATAELNYSVLGAERAIPEYQQRVISEKQLLDEKLRQLLVFIECNYATFGSLRTEEQTRLRKQAEVMRQYSSILADRIALFGAGYK